MVEGTYPASPSAMPGRLEGHARAGTARDLAAPGVEGAQGQQSALPFLLVLLLCLLSPLFYDLSSWLWRFVGLR